ncbi:MAG: hypothetical protein ACKVWV_13975 [Planctomycetota bacterium]
MEKKLNDLVRGWSMELASRTSSRRGMIAWGGAALAALAGGAVARPLRYLLRPDPPANTPPPQASAVSFFSRTSVSITPPSSTSGGGWSLPSMGTSSSGASQWSKCMQFPNQGMCGCSCECMGLNPSTPQSTGYWYVCLEKSPGVWVNVRYYDYGTGGPPTPSCINAQGIDCFCDIGCIIPAEDFPNWASTAFLCTKTLVMTTETQPPSSSSSSSTSGPTTPGSSTSGPTTPGGSSSTSGPTTPGSSTSGPTTPGSSTSGPTTPGSSTSGPTTPGSSASSASSASSTSSSHSGPTTPGSSYWSRVSKISLTSVFEPLGHLGAPAESERAAAGRNGRWPFG